MFVGTETIVRPQRDAQRRTILEMFDSQSPQLAALVAPGGWGKTVLASQILSLPRFRIRLWVDLGGQPMDCGEALLRILRSLSDDASVTREPASSFVAVSEPQCILRAIEERLAEFSGESVCLVVDSLGHGVDLEALLALSRVLRSSTSTSSALVITSRSSVGWGCPVCVEDVLFIDRNDLALRIDEAREIAAVFGVSSNPATDVEACLEVSQGQAALFCLLVRHPRVLISGTIGGEVAHLPLGLTKCIQALVVGCLDDRQRRLLLAAVLAGTGHVSELADAGFTGVDHDAALLLADNFPLLRVSRDACGREVFAVHELAYEALASRDAISAVCSEWGRVLADTQAALRADSRYGRLFDVTLRLGETGDVARWLEALGADYLAQGEFLAVRRLLDRLAPSHFIDRPRLLLLDAAVLKETQRFEDALSRTRLAAQLAEASRDPALRREVLMMEARLLFDMSRDVDVVDTLSHLDPSTLTRDEQCDVTAYYIGCYSQLVRPDLVRKHAALAADYLKDGSVSPNSRAFLANSAAFAQAYILNDARSGIRLVREASGLEGLSLSWHLTLTGNLGTLCYETGRLEMAASLLESIVAECRSRGMACLRWTYVGSLAAVYAAIGEHERANELMASAIAGSRALGDDRAVWGHMSLRAAWNRAGGDLDSALRDAEEAHSRLRNLGLEVHASQAQIESLACRVALEDEGAVADQVAELRRRLDPTSSAFLLLRADMIMAEIERRRDDFDAAVTRIAAHAEYILTEGSNWQIAMYIRAFPGLLSVFAAALTVDRLPAHMLRMVLPDDARRALMFAQETLPAAAYERLAERVLGKRHGREFLQQTSAPVPLKVKVFGGLTVETPWGFVTDKAWCKRKSRLLFAMMVVSRGKDIARDVLFEHMWSGLPAGRAQSNFYVIWSHMRKALAPGPKTACPYVEHRAGVCRIIPELVTTDLDEFHAACDDLRAANSLDDASAVIAAAERVVAVYQGELLPGDLYDDWFTSMRDTLRHEFSDAMLMAANCAGGVGNTEAAIRFTRAGLSQDWWREDLYQAALKYQIRAGQRSSAIETYLTCRSRLSEDLGLDPSLETQRLYEQILAMETRESPGGN